MAMTEKVLAPETSKEVPPLVKVAQAVEWGVVIDGYLVNAAAVGDVFAATLYFDHARIIADGATVVTPPCREVLQLDGFKLLRSRCGADHYVVVTEFNGDA